MLHEPSRRWITPSRFSFLWTMSLVLLQASSRRASAWILSRQRPSPRYFSTTSDEDIIPPWNQPWVADRIAEKRKNNQARFRQHVNPLARQYQLQTVLSDEWPKDVYSDPSRRLHLDIGCGKGGFLLSLAPTDESYNYLGLEIRPGVAQYAKDRIARHGVEGRVDFIGCNANVDLERLLERYVAQKGSLERVTIQFPDPHFKSQHAKRRVVNADLTTTLARFLPTGGVVFLQSDVQPVLDDMRERFREFPQYFADSLESTDEYLPENILGVPTEREISVLEKDLPVYRALFTRTDESVVVQV